MTLVIILNAVSVILLVALLTATMRLPFMIPSGERVRAKARRRQLATGRSRATVPYGGTRTWGYPATD